MDCKEVFDKLRELLEEMNDHKTAAESITTESTLTGDLGFTSLHMLWMAFAIEREFGVIMPDLTAVRFVTVGDVVEFIEAKRA